ncbi:MAG: hypothetical protein MJB57_00985, partial [Gemmatimonadetes bacterium]|nr:hypothetical protein [Gemmatimonadota bacterium]
MSDSDQRVSHLRALHELTADDDHVSPLWAATMITLDLQPATIAAGIDRLTSDTVDVVTPAHWFALGALRREHADRADRPGELVAALDHTLRGLEGDPMSLLGLFNRALIESDLSLCRAAEQTWRRYVEMEPDPRWRAEALDHADRPDCVRSWQSPDDSLQDLLERQIPALLEMAFEEPEWTDAWRTAEALSEMTGDSLVLRILDDIGRLDASDKVDFREYLLIRDGVTAGSADSVAQPFVELAEKVARLVPATTPLVDLDLGRLAIYMGRFETALERLNELGSRSNSDRDPWIAGRADWLRGLALVRGGNREAALSALQRSAATFGTAGYTRAQHSVATLQAETLIELGR